MKKLYALAIFASVWGCGDRPLSGGWVVDKTHEDAYDVWVNDTCFNGKYSYPCGGHSDHYAATWGVHFREYNSHKHRQTDFAYISEDTYDHLKVGDWVNRP